MSSIPRAFLNLSKFINFSVSHSLILIEGVSSTVSIRALTPSAVHCLRHTGNEMSTDILSNPRWRWLCLPSGI